MKEILVKLEEEPVVNFRFSNWNFCFMGLEINVDDKKQVFIMIKTCWDTQIFKKKENG